LKININYDPNNELSEKELDELAEKDFDLFLNYLDQKSAHLLKDKKKISEIKKKSQDILRQNGVKNVKTNRGQWFD
jgi:flagellar basal body-associated protein FliL